MSAIGAEISISANIFSQIFKAIGKRLNTKKEKKLISEIYKELLLGEKGDMYKVKATILELENLGSSSSSFLKAKDYLISAMDAKERKVGFGKFKVVKTKARKVCAKTIIGKHPPKKVTGKTSKTKKK